LWIDIAEQRQVYLLAVPHGGSQPKARVLAYLLLNEMSLLLPLWQRLPMPVIHQSLYYPIEQSIPIVASNQALLDMIFYTVIDLITAIQTTKSYTDYVHQYENSPIEHLEYLGLALYGEMKVVNKFTGSLGLLK
jgi:hypothetical protein